MYRKGTILLPVLIVLFIISLFAALGMFYLYQKESAKNASLQARVVELENSQRETSGQLEEARKAAASLELKLQESKIRLNSLTTELAAEKATHAETSSRLEQLKTDLSEQKSLRADLENRLNQVQSDGKQIKEQIKIIQKQKAELEEKIKDLETGAGGVELGTVVVNPEVSGQPANQVSQTRPNLEDELVKAPQLSAAKVVKKEQPLLAGGVEGKIMIVNKEFNFVVINLGSKDKVSVGDEFSVSRSGKPIGDIKIEKVHEFMSAAGFTPELKDLVRENDKVIQKIK